MSTEAKPALETPVVPVAAALPDNLKSELPVVEKDYGAGKFWGEDSSPKSPIVQPAKTDEVSTEPAEPSLPEIKGLASKWGAKVKAPAEDVKNLIPAKPAVETPKTDEKPAVTETPAWEKMELDSRASPAARDNFKKLKSIAREERTRAEATAKELADAKAALEAARKSPTAIDSTELDRLKKEHKEAMDRLLVLDTKNHPVFQSQYVKPRTEALNSASELLKAKGKEVDVSGLLDKPRGELGKAIQEIVKDLPLLDAHEVTSGIHTAWKLAQAERDALAKAGEVNSSIRQNDSQAHVKAFDSTWNKLAGNFGDILEKAEIPANATPQQRQSLEQYNQAMESLQSQARNIATGASSYESIAEASIKAAAYDLHQKHVMPRIGAEFNAMHDLVRQLTKEVEGYRSRNPNRTISANTTPTADTSGKSQSIEEAAAAAWGSR